MTQKAKRIISIVIVSIILVSSALLIISCNAVKEYEYKNLEDAYEAGWITEDDLRNAEEQIQKITDKYVGLVEKAVADKEKEIMSI